jgi:hypothetical protein
MSDSKGSRTLIIPPLILHSLRSLATADDFDTLSSEQRLHQLQNARLVAQQLLELENRGAELAAYEEVNAALNQNHQHLQTARVLTTAATTAPANRDGISREEKIPDPEEFDGTRANLRTFIDKLRLKISDVGRYPTEQSKLRYAFSRLKGAAFDQVRVYLEDDGIGLENIGTLICHLEAAFDDPDRTATAERHLRMLRQTNKDFATYYVDFMCYAADTTWNDFAKRSQLRAGLCNELLEQLVIVDEPDDLHEFTTL